ncbi:MAG: CsgG/HfaB family protein [Balneolaceae bacterium]
MTKSVLYISAFLLFVSLLVACSGTTKPMHIEPATHGIVSNSFGSLNSLPEPEEKIVAAVYRFRDQTGQYKPSDRIASWSTAVTQGGTSILMKAMEESDWFVPIERESISNLLNERQIIQNIRQQHSGPDGAAILPPLLFAGVMLEGGIVGYDTNVVTGGAGATYLGTGASTQYRKDQVTIYLRAVSTQSGRVLKTVHTTKSIISQQLESGVFRFIDTNRLMEAEAGYTYNEPPVMAVTEAIDEALKQLILEGVEDGVWNAKDNDEVEAYRAQFNYEKQKEEQLKRDYFGILSTPYLRSGWAITPSLSMTTVMGNYVKPDLNPGMTLTVERGVARGFSISGTAQRTKISAPNAYSSPVNAGELMTNLYLTPNYSLSPYVSAGGGTFIFERKRFNKLNKRYFPFVGVEAGFDYRFNQQLGVRLGGKYRYLLVDGLDGVAMGSYNDQHWGVNVGFVYQPYFLN